MKRLIALFASCLILVVLTGCTKPDDANDNSSTGDAKRGRCKRPATA